MYGKLFSNIQHATKQLSAENKSWPASVALQQKLYTRHLGLKNAQRNKFRCYSRSCFRNADNPPVKLARKHRIFGNFLKCKCAVIVRSDAETALYAVLKPDIEFWAGSINFAREFRYYYTLSLSEIKFLRLWGYTTCIQFRSSYRSYPRLGMEG